MCLSTCLSAFPFFFPFFSFSLPRAIRRKRNDKTSEENGEDIERLALSPVKIQRSLRFHENACLRRSLRNLISNCRYVKCINAFVCIILENWVKVGWKREGMARLIFILPGRRVRRSFADNQSSVSTSRRWNARPSRFYGERDGKSDKNRS